MIGGAVKGSRVPSSYRGLVEKKGAHPSRVYREYIPVFPAVPQ